MPDQHLSYENDEPVVEMMGGVSCNFLRRVHSEEWLVERFTRMHPYICYCKQDMAAHIEMLMMPPAIDLGLKYPPFAFPEDVEISESCHEILAEIGCMLERYEVYFEGRETIPDAWFAHVLDVTLVARFIPLLKSHEGELLFHAPHFYQFLDYAGEHAEFAALLSHPTGSNRKMLQVSYETYQERGHQLDL